MPNWCDNTFEVSHKDPKQVERFVSAFKEGRLCAEFIPLPDGEWNWDFCVENWGTKWDVGGDDGYIESDETSARGSFQSAWSPPMGLMPVLEELGFTIKFMYYEPGMNFAGVYQDGIDECYELEDTSVKVENQIPEELDEAFGISENMHQWEEEQDMDSQA
jgi:hypothetical protein